ncbi:MAG: DUF1073 domain-containing protein [Spirochaetes bacterium]|nr:DUF1073 domain-containing protein [Spirochaetota bacterium]
MKRKRSTRTIQHRYDGMMDTKSGRGTSKDRITVMTANPRRFTPTEMRQWYLASGFIQNIVDGPAEDATREWITIKTNRDDDNQETGTKGLGISRIIQNRMTELGFREKLKDLIRFSRLYNEGGILFFGIMANKPQVAAELATQMPEEIISLDYINVISPDYFTINDVNIDPLSKIYRQPKISVQGKEVHLSRLSWMVHSYLPEERRGVSVVETILDAILAQDTSLWSVNHLVYMMGLWIFKSQKVEDLSPDKLAEFLMKMQAMISTMSFAGIAKDEDISRVANMDVNSNLKQLFDFIFENLAGLARMPKSRIMGQSQGVITSGQFDLLNYYDNIAKFQELECRQIIERVISMIVREKNGPVTKALGGSSEGLDWEFTFNSLWRIGPIEQSDIDLKHSQSDQIYITTAVLGPEEVRERRFKDLEQYPAWEKAPINFKTPALKPVEGEKDKKSFAQQGGENQPELGNIGPGRQTQ